MGDVALPEVLRAMESPEPGAVRTAVRLAGEMQSPRAVEPLAGSSKATGGARQEAAKALADRRRARHRRARARAREPVEASRTSPPTASAPPERPRRGAPSPRRAVGAPFPFRDRALRALGRLGRPEPVRDSPRSSRRAGAATAPPAPAPRRGAPRSRGSPATRPSTPWPRPRARATRTSGARPESALERRCRS